MTSRRLRILLVEDSAADARLVQESLRNAADQPFDVVTATTLADAYEAAPGWDIVLLDLGVLDSRGIESLHAVQQSWPTTPIVVLTGVEDPLLAQEAIREGAQAYLPKDALSVELLSRTIRYAIDRKRARQSLDEERAHLFAVLDSLPMFVYLQSPDYTIPFANKKFRELFGDVEGRSCYDVFHGWNEPCEECPPMRVQETGEPEVSEWTSREGRTYAIYDQVFPGSGDAPLTLEVGLDITEQKRSQEALAESEERHRLFFEHAGIGIGYYTPDGETIGYNRIAAAHLGGVPEDFAGEAIVETFGEEKGAEYLRRISDAARSAEPVTYEDYVELPTGPKWFLSTYSRVEGPDGEVLGVQILSEDVTERRRAQASVSEWKNRYEGAVRASGHVLYDWDSETNEVTYGGDVERILGYTEDAMTGGLAHWIELIHPEDRKNFERAINRLVETHEPAHLLYRVRRKDGEYIHVEDDGNFIIDAQSKPIRMLGFVKDVTERRRASERIEESERRYRGMVELSPVGIVTVDLRGEVTSCNRAFEEMTGYTEKELVGKHFTKLPPARLSDVRKYVRMFRAVSVGRTPDPFETTWTRKDGTQREGEVRVALMKREGKLLGVQVIVQDITERNRTLEALRDSETQYRSLFENSVLGIYQTTPDGRILVANPALVRMLGYDSFEELAQRNLEEDGYEPETPRAEFKERIERLGSFAGRESAWKRRDGTTLYVRENARAVRDQDGNVLYYEGTIEDITERKRAEQEAEALRERLELTQYSIDSTEAIVLWVLPDGHFMFVNEAASWMLAYSRDDLLGKAVWDIDPGYPKDRRDETWKELKRLGTEVSESTFRRKDGSEFPVEITAQYIRFKGKEYEFVVAFDISKRKHLEAQLRQSQRLESIGTLASGVAHEINNPLTGIINYAQLISDRIEDKKLKGFADGIKEEGDRVAGIVRNLLSFSRQEKEHSSPARMIDIVNASLSLYGALLRRRGIEVVVDVPEDLPDVRCRSQEIQQVLINLITNARDSLNLRFPDAHGDKKIAIRGRVLEENGRGWIRLSVEDHGQGIPPEFIGRVFDPFFTTKPRDQGTGLGLSISYGLVRDHGGRMNVESVPNEVTRFTVDLPLAER